MKKRVFSGIQPTGKLHLGNLIGAVSNWVRSQDEYDNIFCVVDLHAITVPQDPKQLGDQTRRAIATLLACGIDPEKSLLYVQSHVPAHTELAWILNCVTPIGWLQRMTQFKDKSSKQKSVSTGLLDYPVLQAADITLFDIDLVPVGEDQRQHVELTRDIASRFNHLYGDTLRLPEPLIPKVGARIMGLDDPTIKMSKSVERPSHAISILEDPDRVRRILRSAVTDAHREIRFSEDTDRAGVNNLLTIFQTLTGGTTEEVEAHFDGMGYKELKEGVAEAINNTLAPIRARYDELMADPSTLDELLAKSADEANRYAEATMERVRSALGLLR